VAKQTAIPKTAKVGAVVLHRVPEGKAPEHYLWKKALEREWAGDWGTLARLTDYRYRIGLDPSFVEELPQFKKGQLHWYEWILCDNGGFISLYDDKNRIGKLWTTAQTAEKVLGGGVGAYLYLTSDERLSHVLHFPLDRIVEVCELAGARRRHKGGKGASVERMAELRAKAKRVQTGQASSTDTLTSLDLEACRPL
jgi:hypothetical protein